MGLSEDCVLVRDVSKDSVITAADVTMPPERLSDKLWRDQQRRWHPPAVTSPSMAVSAKVGP